MSGVAFRRGGRRHNVCGWVFASAAAPRSQLGLPIDAREYTAAAHILRDLGVSSLRLITNNPAKVHALVGSVDHQGGAAADDAMLAASSAGGGFGLRVVARAPSVAGHNAENVDYLATKREKMGHWCVPLHYITLHCMTCNAREKRGHWCVCVCAFDRHIVRRLRSALVLCVSVPRQPRALRSCGRARARGVDIARPV